MVDVSLGVLMDDVGFFDGNPSRKFVGKLSFGNTSRDPSFAVSMALLWLMVGRSHLCHVCFSWFR